MDIKTYRARSMQDALDLVRRQLGPDAAVLHTREVRDGGLLGWLRGSRSIEVTASADVHVPSRLPSRMLPPVHVAEPVPRVSPEPAHLEEDYGAKFRNDLKRGNDGPSALLDAGPCVGWTPRRNTLEGQVNDLQSMVDDLCRRRTGSSRHDLPEALFVVFTDMIDADVDEDVARELIDHVRAEAGPADLADPARVALRIAERIESEITVTGPIRVTPGKCLMVALVGPTGVGKTTTIAKLAANFRLREKLRVGLITVDTYRIAAVEQLRTYADIIDLPMEVISTPREMREASSRLADLDLVLLDTAGRSPRDEVRIQELKSMLAEARPDEVHLVLSSVAGARSLATTVEKFAGVGVTSLTLTKLDEATGLGNLLTLLRKCGRPLSYLTNGQNVPDDICVADSRQLARMFLNMDA